MNSPVDLHTEGPAHVALAAGKAGGADEELAGQGVALGGDHRRQRALAGDQGLYLHAEAPGIGP